MAINPGSVTAYGIDLTSRKGDAREMAEMLNFAVKAEEHGVSAYVASLFYDSNSQSCSIKLSRPMAELPEVAKATIVGIGDAELSQFEWEGYIRGRDAT